MKDVFQKNPDVMESVEGKGRPKRRGFPVVLASAAVLAIVAVGAKQFTAEGPVAGPESGPAAGSVSAPSTTESQNQLGEVGSESKGESGAEVQVQFQAAAQLQGGSEPEPESESRPMNLGSRLRAWFRSGSEATHKSAGALPMGGSGTTLGTESSADGSQPSARAEGGLQAPSKAHGRGAAVLRGVGEEGSSGRESFSAPHAGFPESPRRGTTTAAASAPVEIHYPSHAEMNTLQSLRLSSEAEQEVPVVVAPRPELSPAERKAKEDKELARIKKDIGMPAPKAKLGEGLYDPWAHEYDRLVSKEEARAQQIAQEALKARRAEQKNRSR